MNELRLEKKNFIQKIETVIVKKKIKGEFKKVVSLLIFSKDEIKNEYEEDVFYELRAIPLLEIKENAEGQVFGNNILPAHDHGGRLAMPHDGCLSLFLSTSHLTQKKEWAFGPKSSVMALHSIKGLGLMSYLGNELFQWVKESVPGHHEFELARAIHLSEEDAKDHTSQHSRNRFYEQAGLHSSDGQELKELVNGSLVGKIENLNSGRSFDHITEIKDSELIQFLFGNSKIELCSGNSSHKELYPYQAMIRLSEIARCVESLYRSEKAKQDIEKAEADLLELINKHPILSIIPFSSTWRSIQKQRNWISNHSDMHLFREDGYSEQVLILSKDIWGL